MRQSEFFEAQEFSLTYPYPGSMMKEGPWFFERIPINQDVS